MHDRLTIYLDDIVTHERKTVFLNAIEVLLRLGVDEHEFMIDQTLDDPTLRNPDQFLETLEQILLPPIKAYCLQMGVTLSDDTPLAIATDILNALIACEYFEDKESLHALAVDDQDPAEVLSEILAIVGTYSAGQYLDNLETVLPATLRRIQTLTENDSATEAVTPQAAAEHGRARVRAYLKHYQPPAFLKAVENQFSFGLGFFDSYYPYLQDLEQESIEASVQDLVAFILASRLEDFEVVPVVKDILATTLWPHPPQSTQALAVLEGLNVAHFLTKDETHAKA